MALLKLLLATCLTLFVASALATVNDTETFDLKICETILQDNIVLQKSYMLHFVTSIVDKYCVRRKMFAEMKFELSKPINYICLYTNGNKITYNKVSLEYYESEGNSHKRKALKLLNQYTEKDIYIMEFPLLLINKPYYLGVEFQSISYDFGMENIRKDEFEDTHLSRLLDISSGLSTISLTPIFLHIEVPISFAIDYPFNAQLFINTMSEDLESYNFNYIKIFALMSTSIYQIMILMGTNFEKTQYEQIIFWHSPNVKNELECALHISHKLWLQIKPYVRKYSSEKQWLSRPAYSIISPYDEYPTVNYLGVIVYRQADITFNKNENYFARKATVEMTVSYEMSRQILSNLVYPSSWVTKCLQESLAVYLHYNIVDRIRWIDTEVESEVLPMSYLYVVQILQPSLHNEAVFRLKSISHGIDTTDEIDKSFFSRLYYNKVSALLYMLQCVKDAIVLHDDVSKNIKQFVFTLANNVHFWKILAKLDNVKVDFYRNMNYIEILQLWLSQAYYPVVYVQTVFTMGSLTMYFQQYPSKYTNCTSCVWPVRTDICMFSQDGDYKISEMDIYWTLWRNKSIPYTNFEETYDFVIFNFGRASYYRVNYDNKNWIKILQYLHYQDYKKIHVLNRAQLIDDSYHFMMNSQLNWSIFLQLIGYLKRETSYIAWYPMINIMFYMTHFFHHSASEMIKPTLMEIFGSLLENIGYQNIGYENVNDDDMTKSLRLLGSWWACKLGHPVCLETAKKNLYIHLHEPNKYPIKPWWKEWVYCNGVKNKDTNIFINLMEKYNVQFDKKLLRYMACTKNTDNVINIFYKLRLNANLESLRNISKLEYKHISQFVKQHAEDQNMLEFIISNIEDIIPGVLNNSQFWADIILNIYRKSKLLEIKEIVISLFSKNPIIHNPVNILINRQLDRIYKLDSTNYYI